MKKVLTAIVTFIFSICLITATVTSVSAASVGKVKNFKASAAPLTVTLTWSKASGAKGYEIQQKNGKKWKAVATIKKAKTTTYTVKKLRNGTSYQFRIRAVNGKKKSAYVSVKVKTGVQKINSVKAESTGLKSAKLTWEKGNVTGYEIQRKVGKKWKSVKKIKKAKTTSLSVSGLTAGAKNTFRIRGYVNGSAKTYYGSYTTVNVTTTVTPMKDLSVSGVAETSATVKWSKLSGVSGYQVQKFQAGKWVDVNTAVKNSVTQFTVSGLAAYSDQQIRVRAYQKDGKKTFYNEWATVGTKTLIGNVSGVSYSSLKVDGARVSWKAAGGAAGYRVLNNGAKIADVKTTYADLKLGAGTTYNITVVPYNGSTAGAASAAVSFTTPCAQVTGVKVTATTEDSASVSWNKVTGAASYQLQYSKAGGAWSSYFAVNGTSYQIKDLSANSEYSFRVRAVNKNGSTTQYGADSVAATAHTKGLGSFTENTVNWQPVSGASYYEVQYYNSEAFDWEVAATGIKETTLSTTDEIYGDGTTLFKVTAHNDSGAVIYTSNTATEYISDVDFTFNKDKSTVAASWSKDEGAASYEVRIKSIGMTDDGATVLKATDANRSVTSGRLAHGNAYEVKLVAIKGGKAVDLARFAVKAKDFNYQDTSDAGKTNQLLYLVEAINRSKYDDTKNVIIVRSTPNIITQVEKIEFGIKGADTLVKKTAVKGLLNLLFENPESKYPGGCVIEDGFLKCTSAEAIDGLFAEKNADGTIKESMAYSETNPKLTTSKYTFEKGEQYSYSLGQLLQPAGGTNKLAYLYNSNVDAAWANGFSKVVTTKTGSGYRIEATLKKETNKTSYHDGFVKGASMTDIGDMGLGGAGKATVSSNVGTTTIVAEIDENCLLTTYEIYSPYEFDMNVEVSLASDQMMADGGSDDSNAALNLVMSLFKNITIGMKTEVKGTQSYNYTFIRKDAV